MTETERNVRPQSASKADGKLINRNIVVTGAAQGIGAAFAQALARQGANVSISDTRSPEEIVIRIRQDGGNAIGRICDVTDARAVATLIEATNDAFVGIHGLVNNAALFATLPKRPFEEISSEEFDRVMAVNIRGAFECMKAVSPVMRRQRYGKIINIASGTVFKGVANMAAYVASKGAVVAMTRCIARELGGSGITVNCLAPGITMSEGVMRQEDWVLDSRATIASRCIQREQTPDDLTGALGFLLSSDSDFMTGQTVVVDGGAVLR